MKRQTYLCLVRLAQRIARLISTQKVVGSNPTVNGVHCSVKMSAVSFFWRVHG